jgi:SOS-response transcriptional repressor LexA
MDNISAFIKNRIMYFIENQQIKKVDFFRKTGMSASNFKGKGLSSELGGDKIAKFLSVYPDVSAEWLITGKGPMLINKDTSEYPNEPYYNKPINLQYKACSFYKSMDSFCEETEPYFRIPDFSKAEFLERVKGDAMSPKYNNEDLVACKKETSFIPDNKIYAIRTKSMGLIIRRVSPAEKSTHITLISENKDYPPFDIPFTEVEDIALVLGAVTIERE